MNDCAKIDARLKDTGTVEKGNSHVGDLQLVTILECWRQNLDLDDIFWMLVPNANVKR